jgi:EAL domain-containing protein (putative c-di-GMP-specific phosphodiesterase class I)
MIKNIDTNKNSQLITQTIVDFAKKMNIQTVAEFVYSKNIFDKILELDVDYAQGYYFGEPSETIE